VDHYLYATVLTPSDAGALVIVDHPGNLAHGVQRFVPANKILTAVDVKKKADVSGRSSPSSAMRTSAKTLMDHIKGFRVHGRAVGRKRSEEKTREKCHDSDLSSLPGKRDRRHALGRRHKVSCLPGHRANFRRPDRPAFLVFVFAGAAQANQQGVLNTITVDNDADFRIRWLIVSSTGLFSVEIKDLYAGGAPWMPTPVNGENFAGTAQLPFVLPKALPGLQRLVAAGEVQRPQWRAQHDSALLGGLQDRQAALRPEQLNDVDRPNVCVGPHEYEAVSTCIGKIFECKNCWNWNAETAGTPVSKVSGGQAADQESTRR